MVRDWMLSPHYRGLHGYPILPFLSKILLDDLSQLNTSRKIKYIWTEKEEKNLSHSYGHDGLHGKSQGNYKKIT